MPGDVRRKYTPGSGVVEVMRPARKCNGMTYDADLNLLVCEHVTSQLVRERPTAAREILAYHYEGKYLNSPNDVIVTLGRDDLLLRPVVRPHARLRHRARARARLPGRLPDPAGRRPGRARSLLLPKDEFDQPNGLCFSPDEKLLYINDTPRAHIKVFDVNADGTLSNGRMFFEGIGTGVIEEGIPDGMKCDERGNIWVTGPQGVWVISPDGRAARHRSRCPRPSATTRWGGDGLEDALHPLVDARSTRSARRSARAASPTCADL